MEATRGPRRGEVLEWLNRHAWKACGLFTGARGFESHPLRQLFSDPPAFGRRGCEGHCPVRSRDGRGATAPNRA